MAIEGNKQIQPPAMLDVKAMQEIHRQQQVYNKLNPEIFATYAKLPDTIQFAFTKETGEVIKVPKDKMMTIITGMSNEGAKRNLVAWFYNKNNLAALANAPQGEIITVNLSKAAVGEDPLAKLNEKNQLSAKPVKQGGLSAKAETPQKPATIDAGAQQEVSKVGAVETAVSEIKVENARFAEVMLSGIIPPKGEDPAKYKRLLNPLAEVGGLS